MELPKFNLSKNLQQRIISAAILAPLVLAIIYYGQLPFAALVILAALLMAFEWHDMTVCHASEKDKLFSKRWQLAGIAYIALPCISLLALRNTENGLGLILWVLFIVWATDIAAYFTGRTLGGPKLAPSISPNKTWSGLAGGVVAASFVGFIAALLLASPHTGQLVILSGILAMVAQMGDLLESGLKRHFNIKDSGTIIPGHGGILDRIDGIITVAPVVGLLTLLRSGGLF